MANTRIQGTDLNNPLSGVTFATLSGTNLSIASGGSILPVISGANVGGASIGSASFPFSSVFSVSGTYTNIVASSTVSASVLSGTTISGLNYTIASGGSFLPVISGTGTGGVSLGSAAKPFSGVYVKNVNNALVIASQMNEVPVGAVDGSNAVFYLSYAPYNYGLSLYKGGMYMTPSGIGAPNFDYVLVTSGITFLTAPASGIGLVANYNYLA